MQQQTNNTSDIEKSITGYNYLTIFLSVIAAFIGVASVIFTIQVSKLFLLGFIPVILLIVVIQIISATRWKLKYLLQIRKDWGQERIIKKRNLKAIRPLFDKISSLNRSGNVVDEQTWKDLNMDELYTTIDRTYTDPGESVLYDMLREPLYTREGISERSHVIRFFQSNREAGEKIQLALIRLGHQLIQNDIFNLLWRDSLSKTGIKLFYYFMAIAAVISIFLPLIFWSLALISIPIVIFIINMLIHYRLKQKNEYETASFPYLIQCIKTAGEISVVTNGEIKNYTNKLAEMYKASSKIVKNTRFLFPTRSSFTD